MNNNNVNFNNNIRLSPHKICLCALIDHYLNAQLHPFQKKSLSILLLKYIKNPDSYNEPTLYDIILELKKIRISNVFLTQELIEYITFETIDDLQQFFSSIKIFFEKERQVDENDEDEDDEEEQQQQQKEYLDGKSVLGLFVKKVLLIFNQSLFDGLISLYNQMRDYINQYHYDLDNNRNNKQIQNNNNNQTNNNNNNNGKKISFLSPMEQERFVYEEISKINNSIGKVNPLDIKEHIDIIKSVLPNVNKSRYIDQSHMDYEQSVEELHRYFDYCNGDGAKRQLLSGTGTKHALQIPTSIGHYIDGQHRPFPTAQPTGHPRQRNTPCCRTRHVVAIIHQSTIENKAKHESNSNIINRSNNNNTSINNNNSNITNNNNNKLTINNNNSNSTNNNNNNNSKYYNDIFSLLESSQRINRSNNLSILQMKSTVWEIFGNLELSTYFNELSFRFNNNNSQLNEFIHYQSNTNSSKDTIITYCKLALTHCKKGDFESAQNIIGYCMNEYPYHNHIKSILLYTSLCIMFEVALAESNLDRAHLVLESLLPLLNRLSPDDSEQAGWSQIFATYTQVGRYFIKSRQFDVAHQFLNDAIRLARDNGYESLTTEFHVLLAQLFQECGGVLSMQSGMSNMLCALSLSDHYNQPTLSAESNLLLIKTHLESGDFERAYSLLEITLPMVLQDCQLQAKLYLLYAKTIFRESQFNKSVNKKLGIEYLEKAQACAKQLSNKEMLKEISSYLINTMTK
ncbi:anaphase promoting complex subunit 5 [Heterostelium album PN500]|uniref:Anaphase promoting complex subunit 5 n=1 Tax=Heterostelium pallidum (strain ATCC 26659 / Pp 5 / PN500) TaxID=670386 RepID=D3BA78_HETP5|nr:anaphase promoting complex subunit 5 [Heterostelium album PN500]EFA81465.1 anaphase promoting complex subunit 5 [Heterostelium album PN500]|eukprot:XP_020433583.1 anaphase promoting complex subunit 5 [Heterostelium album PN500]